MGEVRRSAVCASGAAGEEDFEVLDAHLEASLPCTPLSPRFQERLLPQLPHEILHTFGIERGGHDHLFFFDDSFHVSYVAICGGNFLFHTQPLW